MMSEYRRGTQTNTVEKARKQRQKRTWRRRTASKPGGRLLCDAVYSKRIIQKVGPDALLVGKTLAVFGKK